MKYLFTRERENLWWRKFLLQLCIFVCIVSLSATHSLLLLFGTTQMKKYISITCVLLDSCQYSTCCQTIFYIKSFIHVILSGQVTNWTYINSIIHVTKGLNYAWHLSTSMCKVIIVVDSALVIFRLVFKQSVNIVWWGGG